MKYRNRKQATAYLRENGIPIGDNGLAHLAVDGEGPEFRYSGRHPVYTEDALDAWIEARLSRPVRSPTEAAAARLNTLPDESDKPDSNPLLSPPTRIVQHRAADPPITKRRKNKIAEPDILDRAS